MVAGSAGGSNFEGLRDLELGLLSELLPLVKNDLPSKKVEGLNSGGSLVEGGDTGIAHDLLHAIVLDEAGASVDLHAKTGALDSKLSEPSLHGGSVEAELFLAFFPNLLIIIEHAVGRECGIVNHCPARLGEGLDREKVLANVGVDDDLISDVVGILLSGKSPHTGSVHAPRKSTLVAPLHVADSLHGSAQASGVHKGEHLVKSIVGLPDEPALGVLKAHDTGGGGLNSHLVLDSNARDVPHGGVLLS
mmetsp:Transcript_21422/g.44621  ORF Transcript_21422/g.44621 Transcript_21422/m.44621 type:complete len:248 (-) Transcript_21422:884-1627(-)